MPAEVLRWLVALSFFAVALWALKPDKLDDDEPPPATRWGVFGVTVVAFFLAEMGDKTQVATVMLAAKFPSLLAVVLGTTLGMLLANVPVVLRRQARRRRSRSRRCASSPRCSSPRWASGCSSPECPEPDEQRRGGPPV